VVWADNVSLYLVNLGPGVAKEFREAHVAIDTLEAVFVNDPTDAQAADSPALLTSAGAAARKDDLPIYGPVGIAARVATFFNAKKFDHFNSATPFRLVAHDVGDTKNAVRTIFTSTLGEVDALSVANGQAPALAYRVRINGKSFVIAPDCGGDALMPLAMGADVLICEGLPGARAGEIAAAAKVKLLVLPHRPDSERTAKPYRGPVSFLADHECLR
jgi:ribonuclease BN (tRNA processing enzyme)